MVIENIAIVLTNAEKYFPNTSGMTLVTLNLTSVLPAGKRQQ